MRWIEFPRGQIGDAIAETIEMDDLADERTGRLIEIRARKLELQIIADLWADRSRAEAAIEMCGERREDVATMKSRAWARTKEIRSGSVIDAM